ncbi:MAG TPA: hypothetical protein ENK23_05865 [Sorangium sp.]|nr:hypothetical protein [Sorangium sp.]
MGNGGGSREALALGLALGVAVGGAVGLFDPCGVAVSAVTARAVAAAVVVGLAAVADATLGYAPWAPPP